MKKLYTFKNGPVFFGPPCVNDQSQWNYVGLEVPLKDLYTFLHLVTSQLMCSLFQNQYTDLETTVYSLQMKITPYQVIVMMMCNDLMCTQKLTGSQLSLAHNAKVKTDMIYICLPLFAAQYCQSVTLHLFDTFCLQWSTAHWCTMEDFIKHMLPTSFRHHVELLDGEADAFEAIIRANCNSPEDCHQWLEEFQVNGITFIKLYYRCVCVSEEI